MRDMLYKANCSVCEISPRNGRYYTLEELQGFVGGLIELVHSKDGGSVMVVNENGKLEGLAPNVWGTNWANEQGLVDYIVGDVAVVASHRIK